MIQNFLDYIAIERKYSDKTVIAYNEDLRDFCSFYGWEIADFDPKQVDEDDVREWLIHLQDEKRLSKRTIKRKFSALHSLYRFLLRVGATDKDVTRRIILPKTDKKLPVFFKPSEMEKATEYEEEADDFEGIRDALIIEMLYQTGMRQAEMLGLKDADIDTSAAQIRVFGKRKKERIIPIGEALCSQIGTYLQARSELVALPQTFFVRRKKSGEVLPMSKDVLYRIVCSRMGEVSTLEKHSPHVLRHTFATTMLNNGADIRTIQSLLGHASLAATQVYTHTTFEQIRQAYKKAHPRCSDEK